MQTVNNLNFAGKKALVKVGFSVPLDENFNIINGIRMHVALPALKRILTDGDDVIIGSRLGRPRGVAEKFSLKHVLRHLSGSLGVDVQPINDCIDEEADAKAAALQPGEVLLPENLRFYTEEEDKPRGLVEDASNEERKAIKKTTKENQKEFTKRLASYADCYVNDAPSTTHYAHVSTTLIADYFSTDNKMFGYLMEKEVKAVGKITDGVQRPFITIMSGSEVPSKIEIIENLLNKVDDLTVTGSMAYTFARVQGGKIGKSTCEDDKLDLALNSIKRVKKKGVNLISAVDVKTTDDLSNDTKTNFAPTDQIPNGREGLGIGSKTETIYADVIKNSKMVFQNGPAGVFELENFMHGSYAVGEAIVETTKNGTFPLIDGGNSVACVNKFGLANGASHVSTGGGVLLEVIGGKVLSGIIAVKGEAYR